MNVLNKKSVKDIDVKGKKVLVRCDFNVKMENGVITSDKRIVASLPTIQYLLDNGAKLIVSAGGSGWRFPFRTEAHCGFEVVDLLPTGS